REEDTEWTDRAVALYHAEQARILAPKERRKGLRRICEGVEAESNYMVKLAHATIGRLVKGGRTLAESNAAKGWLLEEEVEVVIGYALDIAARGFPLSHHRLKECVDDICRARLGDEFPGDGVGINWTQRFCKKYSDRLQTCW
ncbi:hypothetical protein C8F04DRAFT_883046, partial [Mycena alexandri]